MCFYLLWCFSANLYFMFHNKLQHLVPHFATCVCGNRRLSGPVASVMKPIWSLLQIFQPSSVDLLETRWWPWSWENHLLSHETDKPHGQPATIHFRQYPQHLMMLISLYDGSLGKMLIRKTFVAAKQLQQLSLPCERTINSLVVPALFCDCQQVRRVEVASKSSWVVLEKHDLR